MYYEDYWDVIRELSDYQLANVSGNKKLETMHAAAVNKSIYIKQQR